jgi:hypothetical protein
LTLQLPPLGTQSLAPVVPPPAVPDPAAEPVEPPLVVLEPVELEELAAAAPVELLAAPLDPPLVELLPEELPPVEAPPLEVDPPTHWPFTQVPLVQLPVWQGFASQPSLPPQTVHTGWQQDASVQLWVAPQLAQALPPTPQLAASVPSSQVLPVQQPDAQLAALQLHWQMPPQPSETVGPHPLQAGLQQA